MKNIHLKYEKYTPKTKYKYNYILHNKVYFAFTLQLGEK